MANIIDGTENGDLLIGTAGADIINGFGGNDTLLGEAGNDKLYGGAGFDFLDGGEGNDELYGGAGPDFLDGGAGDDYIDPGSSNDGVVTGSTGSDTIDYSNVTSGFGNLQFRDLLGIVAIIDIDGDFAQVESGSDTDTILGIRNLFEVTDGLAFDGTNYDDVFIIDFNDLTESQLILSPGDGTDSYYIGGDYDGHQSNVRLTFTFGADWSIVEDGVHIDLRLESGQIINDGYGNPETIFGPGYVRQFFLTFEDDTFYGGDGDERIRTYSGNDHIDGGGGIDRLDMGSNEFASLVVNLDEGWATGSCLGPFGWQPLNYTLANIENVMGARSDSDHITGSDGDNSLRGRGGDDILIGLGGDDSLRGDQGEDRLVGGAGMDTLDGGTDADEFVFGAFDDIDTILDFEIGIDKIVLQGTGLEYDDLSIREVIEVGGGEIPFDRLPEMVAADLSERFQKAAIVSFEQTEIHVLLAAGESLSADDFLFEL